MGTDFVYRRLAGDLGQNDVEDMALRKEIFRSSRRHFYGFGLFGGVQLKNVSAEFNIPVLFTRREPDGSGRKSIPGLTGIQLVTRIRFVGGVPLYDFGK